MRHRISPILLAALTAWLPGAAQAQQTDGNAPAGKGAPTSGYVVGESARPGRGHIGDNDTGPVRMARFAFVQGRVMWRAAGAAEETEPENDAEWTAATINLPLRPGAQIWVADGGRAELQFDDGSLLRLGDGALVTLRALLSDADGAFTDIALSNGLVSLRPRHEFSGYRISTPLAAVSAAGPANLRIGVARTALAGGGRTVAARDEQVSAEDERIVVEVALRSGQATLEGRGGEKTLATGDYVQLRSTDTNGAAYVVRRVPSADSWERWNDERDRYLADGSRVAPQHLPPNVALVASELDSYGSWQQDESYGAVWSPREQWLRASWRPYQHGRWTWLEPFGWTWVSSEPWGWAPYHYGSWIHRPYGWAWVPGPANQFWCPALVHFSSFNGIVSWVPLAPSEIAYPSAFSIGFGRGRWYSYFSIGRAAAYYPIYNPIGIGSGYSCIYEARPYPTVYINKIIRVARRERDRERDRRERDRRDPRPFPGRDDRTEPAPRPALPRGGSSRVARGARPGVSRSGAEPVGANRSRVARAGGPSGFVPANARSGGAVVARAGDFDRGNYQTVTPVTAAEMTRGQSPAAPASGEVPVSGPLSVPPPAEANAPQFNPLPPGERNQIPSGAARRSPQGARERFPLWPAREPRRTRSNRDAPSVAVPPVVAVPPQDPSQPAWTQPGLMSPRNSTSGRNTPPSTRSDTPPLPPNTAPSSEAAPTAEPNRRQRREERQREERRDNREPRDAPPQQQPDLNEARRRDEAQREEARRQQRQEREAPRQQQRQERREERREERQERRSEPSPRNQPKNPPQNNGDEDNDGKRRRGR